MCICVCFCRRRGVGLWFGSSAGYRKSAWIWQTSQPRKQPFPVPLWPGGNVGGYCMAKLMHLKTVGRPSPVVGSRLHQRSTTVYTGHTVKQLVGRGHEDGPQARNTFKAVIRKGRYNVQLSKCNQRIPQTIWIKSLGWRLIDIDLSFI